MKTLAINRCPAHKGYFSISIDDADHGVRITPSKCCGQWRPIKVFYMSAANWRELAKQAAIAAEEEEAAENG